MNASKLILFVCIAAAGCDKTGRIIDEGTGVPPTETTETRLQSYTFRRNGVNTVDLGESVELIQKFKSFNNGVNAKTLSSLDYYKKILDEHLLSRVAVDNVPDEQEKVKTMLSGFMDELQGISKSKYTHTKATDKHPGYIPVSSEENRYVNAKGVELGQVLQKFLMGSMLLSQINHNMQRAASVQTNDKVEGEEYTSKEHFWDVAYGMLGRNDLDKKRGEPLFIANYIEKEAVGMKGLENIQTEIYVDFYLGRKSISENNPAGMEKAMKNIRRNLGKMFYLRTIHYLNESNLILNKSGETPNEAYFHSIAEALGFILALPFVKDESDNSRITVAEAEVLFDSIISGEQGLWEKDRLIGTGDNSITHAIKVINEKFKNFQ